MKAAPVEFGPASKVLLIPFHGSYPWQNDLFRKVRQRSASWHEKSIRAKSPGPTIHDRVAIVHKAIVHKESRLEWRL